MPDPEAAVSRQKNRVFISFARADMAFADRLSAALEARGYSVLIDRRDLPSLEDWRRELLFFMRQADTVVFIVSARSVASPVCQWEVEQAAALNKRLAPVILERVDSDRIPAAITRTNFLYFDLPNAFEAQADALARALQTDIAWWREHTRFVELAGRWHHDGRPEGQLLRSGEITAAHSWASRRPDDARIPEVVFQFLDASVKKEEHDRQELNERKQRTLVREEGLLAAETRRGNIFINYRRGDDPGFTQALYQRLEDEFTAGALFMDVEGYIKPGDDFVEVLRAQVATCEVLLCVIGPRWTELLGHRKSDEDDFVAIEIKAALDQGKRVIPVLVGGASMPAPGTLPEAVRTITRRNAVSLRPDRFKVDCQTLVTELKELLAAAEEKRRAARATVDRKAEVSPELAANRRLSHMAQRLIASEAHRNREAHRDAAALRIALAGEPTDEERMRGLTAEPTLRAQLCAAAYNADILACLSGHSGPINTATFRADGAWVLTASDDNTARLWDVTTGAQLARLTHDAAVRSAVFSPDGARVATASDDRTARVWNAARGAELARFHHDQRVRSIAFSADGARVVTASDDNSARVWDIPSGLELARLAHNSEVKSAAFSGDAVQIVTASNDKTARVWDAASGAEMARLAHDGEINSAAFSPDGRRLVTASWDNSARVWDVASGAQIVRVAHGNFVAMAAFSNDGLRIVTASNDKTARVWDAASGAEMARLAHDSGVRSAAFSADGVRLVTASYDGTARVWDAASGVEFARFHHDERVMSAAFSPDGARVVTASNDNTARIWDAASRIEFARLDHDRRVNTAIFSADGARVLTASGNTARVWHAASGTELAPLVHNSEVLSVAFSVDGERVLTVSHDGMARLWDAATGTQLAQLVHDDRVNSAVFSANAEQVLTASNDRTARIWHAASGLELVRLAHYGPVYGAVFSADGSRVLTASGPSVRLWDVTWLGKLSDDSLPRAVARARLIGQGRLTEEELRTLRPILGDVDPHVVSRLLAPSPNDAETEAILAQWRNHREMAVALAHKDWAGRAAEIQVALASPQTHPAQASAIVSNPRDVATTADSNFPARGPNTRRRSLSWPVWVTVTLLFVLALMIAALVTTGSIDMVNLMQQLSRPLVR